MSALDNFLNNINVDEEIKKIQSQDISNKSINNDMEMSGEMSNMDVVADTAASLYCNWSCKRFDLRY